MKMYVCNCMKIMKIMEELRKVYTGRVENSGNLKGFVGEWPIPFRVTSLS